MSDNDSNSEITTGAPTRREYVKYGGAVIGGGLLAGCAGEGSPASGANSSNTSDGAGDTTTDSQQSSYSVTIEPAGEITFNGVPETWIAENASWADMGVSLGLRPPSAVVLTSEYRTWHYEDIPGFSVDKGDITSLWQNDGISKEIFYDHDADVHFIDPNYMTNLIPNWKQQDITEITENVAPFCGNTSFSTYPWHEDYPYYELYEATQKVAQVFQREKRYQALLKLHNQFVSRVKERLPPEQDRPAIALLSPASTKPEKFYPYRLGTTTAYKHWHDLGVSDALGGSNIKSFTSDRGTIDYEPLLEIDPEVLMFYTDEYRASEDFQRTYVEFMQEHSTASQLTAVQNGDVYPAGGMYQGPIINLSKTERAARQLYSEEFSNDERLYDRQRVADIITGEF